MLPGPLDPSHAPCSWCGTSPITRLVWIDYHPQDHVAFGSPAEVCDTCHDLFVQGRDGDLAARLTEEYDDWGRAAVVRYLRGRVSEFTAAHPAPPELPRLRRDGFEPLEEHTGAVDEVAAVWPAAHRMSIPDPRSEPGEDRSVWLVRSPWAAITVSEVMDMLWPWVERDEGGGDGATRTARMREVFAWGDDEAASWLAQVNRS